MKLPLLTVMILLLQLLPVYAPAQFSDPYNFKFRNYSAKDGLVHSFVRKCQSDSKGFLWVITQNGLSRFDGLSFKNFQNIAGDSTSLPYNDLTDLTIDKQDRVWLAYKSGICFYDPRKGCFTRLSNPVTLTKMQGVCYDGAADKIWATSFDGLISINAKTLEAKQSLLQAKLRNGVSSINIDSKRRLWITVHRGGVFCYNLQNETYSEIAAGPWTMHVYEDYNRQLWVSTWAAGLQKLNGVAKPIADDVYDLEPYDASGNTVIFQASAQCKKLTGSDIIWLAIHQGGVALFSISQKRFVRHILYNPNNKSGILSNYNNYIYEAPDGILWICSWFGLTKASAQEQQFRTTEIPELQLNMYNCISGIVDDPSQSGVGWMTVNGEGILRYDLINNKITNRYYFISRNKSFDEYYMQRWTRGLVSDNYGSLWTGSYGGFIEMKNNKVTYYETKRAGNLIYGDELKYFKNSVWLMGDEILARFNPATHQYETFALPDSLQRPKDTNDDYESFCDGSGDSVFMGSRSGLFLLNLTTRQFSRFNFSLQLSKDGLWKSCNDIWKIDSILYVAADGGLAAINLQTQQATIIGKSDGILKLEDDCLFSDKKKKLWIYSSHGLYCYTPQTKTFRKFTTADGLYNTSSDLVNFFQYRDDIYIGYRGAYTKFNPDKIDENTSLPIPYITAVSTKEITPFIYPQQQNELLLSHTNNDINFSITAIEYNNPERVGFSYKLEGFDKEWIVAKSREINYTNLPHGHYRFLLKAKNSNGLWSTKTASFSFKIATPFWRTTWFSVTCIFVSAILLYSLFTWRVKRIRKEEEQKTAINKMIAEQEMKALRSQMNPHFIFNSLNSIQKYIWEAKQEDAAEYLTKFARLIRSILENSAQKLVTLQNEMASLKLYLELEHRRSNQKFDYSISIDEAINTEQTLLPPLLLQPYIENAIWHGLNPKKSRGELFISIKQNEKIIICIIDDNGIGREASQQHGATAHKSMGLNISQERIALMQNEAGISADVLITDKQDNEGRATGTTVKIILPLILHHD